MKTIVPQITLITVFFSFLSIASAQNHRYHHSCSSPNSLVVVKQPVHQGAVWKNSRPLKRVITGYNRFGRPIYGYVRAQHCRAPHRTRPITRDCRVAVRPAIQIRF